MFLYKQISWKYDSSLAPWSTLRGGNNRISPLFLLFLLSLSSLSSPRRTILISPRDHIFPSMPTSNQPAPYTDLLKYQTNFAFFFNRREILSSLSYKRKNWNKSENFEVLRPLKVVPHIFEAANLDLAYPHHTKRSQKKFFFRN